MRKVGSWEGGIGSLTLYAYWAPLPHHCGVGVVLGRWRLAMGNNGQRGEIRLTVTVETPWGPEHG